MTTTVGQRTDGGTGQGGTGPLVRPRFFPRQVVTADDLTAGEEYLRERLRRHNRLLHGFGIVAGLDVARGPDLGGVPSVTVTPGYAISPDGDEIFVPTPQTVRIDCIQDAAGDCMDLSSSPTSPTAYLVLRAVEQPFAPVPALPDRCAPRPGCEPTRWREGFEFACLRDQPPAYADEVPCDQIVSRFRDRLVPAYSTIPSGRDVVLACVTLEQSAAAGPILVIDQTCRRVLYSTSFLQAVIRCQPTGPAPGPPVRVTAITPADGANVVITSGSLVPAISATVSKRLNPVTVTSGSLVVLMAPTSNPNQILEVGGTVEYDDATRTIRFRPHWPLVIENSLVTVRLRGQGPNTIFDIDNLRLDGDADGVEGGDFHSEFRIFIGEPHPVPHEVHEVPHEVHEVPHEVHDIHEIHEIHEFHHLPPHAVEPIVPINPRDPTDPILPVNPIRGVQPVQPAGPFLVPVESLPGISPAMANTLRANGIADAATLAAVDPAVIGAMLGISHDAASVIVNIGSHFQDG